MSADAQAWALVIAALAGRATEAEQQFLRAVARFETFYARGWKGEGEGSNNWGAVHATANWPGETFSYTDSHENGERYEQAFRKYPDPAAGIQDMARFLLKPAVKEAIARGDGLGAVKAQRESGYFVAPLALYQGKVAENFGKMIAATGEAPLLRFSGSGGGGGLALFALAAAGLGAFIWKTPKGRKGGKA